MLFISTNELDCFQFHDATIKEITLADNTMAWKVLDINAMTTNTQNNNEKDMCIKEATMFFDEILIGKIEFGAYATYDSDRNLIQSVGARTERAEEYDKILRESTDKFCFIYGMDGFVKLEDERYRVCFNIDCGVGNYYLTFSFSESIVKWAEYSGEAWYEHPKWKK